MFFKRKQQPYKITVVGQYGTYTYDCETEKAKREWLYNYLANDEGLWAWEQWQQSPYRTFDKWVKEFTREQFKWADLQTFRINKTLILVKKIKNN